MAKSGAEWRKKRRDRFRSTPPDVVGISGQNGVAVGTIAIYRNNPQAVWLWIVTDNLRLRAENALLVAQELV